MQVIGEAVSFLNAFVCHGNFLIQIGLAAMCLITDADNVGAVRQQLNIFIKLVDGG